MIPSGPPKQIKFTQHWNNKLDCKMFTTIRKKDFPLNTNDICEIILNGKKIKDVQVVQAHVLPFRDLNWACLALDTGYIAGALKIFQNFGINTDVDDVKLLILKTI